MTRESPSVAQQALCDAIVRYLARRPGAADTLEGIARWWIPMQRLEAELAEVTLAVEALVAGGVLEGAGYGPARRYRLRPREVDPEATEGA